ncbi:AI-2E family transporter [Methylomonas koyamae]|uniref:AI-2E family transporter n=2 Tax=Methylomonas koyamae TaxID=702114 RepID=A0A177NLN4_9GAMM|nr:AI-2E family transporter [Methylomonas koyamae]ATG90237.1 AI-2E family transporter [Methylomonas koyamae]OAI18099.1 AI-2E family transporter [Methylomonas koyamae]OAI25349.1 AI-2E family transporter [Methylomonas koyamae]WNB77820.1 AI-2E family transporter [Methylomonas koyamae]BBL58409.1 AI-2E family transporter [Methylomonas koyamae]
MNQYSNHSSYSVVRHFFRRFFPDSQVAALAIILLGGFLLIYSLLGLLMPVFVAVVLAYLLEGLVAKLEMRGVARLIAVHLVFFAFMAALGFVLFVLVPMVSEQTVQLVQHIPEIVSRTQAEIMRFPERHPELISETRIREIMFTIQQDLLKYGQDLISGSAQSFVGLVAVVIYLFLVPLMVFFFLKDKRLLLGWMLQFLPSDTSLSLRVWQEVDKQISNYVRGKFVEVFILWAISYLVFWWLGLNYAMLLAVLMGLSVVIPYVGATLVTFPVLGVAYVQWGVGGGDQFMYVFIAYSVIQALDGVILVPLLFSEAVNLHPVAIIVAILFFGGLWGFWGVFFAIPLATLVKAVLTAWPRWEANGTLAG